MPLNLPISSRLLLPVFLALGLSFSLRAEPPKFAVVDVSKAFDAYHVTADEKSKVAAARAELKKDKRLEQIKLTRVELVDLRKSVADATLPEAQRQEYFLKFQMKAHELRSLQRDTIQYLDDENQNIDRAMVARTRELLETVRRMIRQLAEEGGYDYVFELGGKTSSQIPPLIYIRNATDLTEDVIEALNKLPSVKKAVATTEAP